MKAGLQEFPVATFRVWSPWPARLEQLMGWLQPGTLMEPVQVNVGVHVHHALLQGSGQRQDLEGGAGLIGVVDALVPPLRCMLLACAPVVPPVYRASPSRPSRRRPEASQRRLDGARGRSGHSSGRRPWPGSRPYSRPWTMPVAPFLASYFCHHAPPGRFSRIVLDGAVHGQSPGCCRFPRRNTAHTGRAGRCRRRSWR